VGFILPGGMIVLMHLPTGSSSFALNTEPEAMETTFNAMDRWLLELGFFPDPDLGRVRNPFDFLRGEADPALQECFVKLGEPSWLTLGSAGSGKSAALTMRALHSSTLIRYQSVIVFDAVLEDMIALYTPRSPAATVTIGLDIDDEESIDPRSIAQVLDQVRTLQGSPQAPPIIVALPEKFLPIAKPYQPWQIQWTHENLANLLELRLRWASEGKISSLDQISEGSLTKTHTELSDLSKTPRDLFRLGQQLFRFHAANPTLAHQALLQEDDWSALLAHINAGNQQNETSVPDMTSTARDLLNAPSDPAMADHETCVKEEIKSLLRRINLDEYDRSLPIAWNALVELEKQIAGHQASEIRAGHQHDLDEKRKEVMGKFENILRYEIKKTYSRYISNLSDAERQRLLVSLLRSHYYEMSHQGKQ
jgi:hypothetical protein